MPYVKAKIIGTADDHFFFNRPFIDGVSLRPVDERAIDEFRRARYSDTESLTAAEATAHIGGLIQAGTDALSDFAADLSKQTKSLAPLIADAAKLADLPVDLAADRAVIREYVSRAEAIASAPAPDVALADLAARRLDLGEGLDRAALEACFNLYEASLRKVDSARRAAHERASELRAALTKLDDPTSAARLAGLKLQRDLSRIVPDLVEEFSEAREQAGVALARMDAIATKLQELANVHG
jgi:hypothetical protein